MNKVTDPKGNYYTVSYTEDSANGAYYPNRLDYTGNSNTGLTPYNSLRFTYETRPDFITHYQAGSFIKLTQRLSKIESYADSALVRRYTLTYENTGAANSSRVTSVQECGSDGTSCLPETTFSWSQEGGLLGTDTNKYVRTAAMAVMAYYTFGATTAAVQASMEAAAGACFTTTPAKQQSLQRDSIN